MSTLFRSLGALPSAPELPPQLPSPFDECEPQAVVRSAAEALQARLSSPGMVRLLEGGKMFGVLVARAQDGQLGYLCAYSGALAGRFDVEGFVPPLFDPKARARFEPEGEARVKELGAQYAAMAAAPERALLQSRLAALDQRQAQEQAELRQRHRAKRARRQERRASGAGGELIHLLEQESRADKAERRRVDASHLAERGPVAAAWARADRRLRALERLRHTTCRALMRRIHDGYQLTNFQGEQRSLRSLYLPGEPPAGAGDCAAPKLLGFAQAHRLRPLALGEFWWGPPPAGGGRLSGRFYPACRGKCGPLLPFMLKGLAVAQARWEKPGVAAPAGLKVVFEDEWLVVVDKPAGLLSVPGRDAAATDSVLTQLRTRYPAAEGPLLVHRLDQDTSGLLLAAKDARTHLALQRQFLGRTIEKRYIAWVEGTVLGARGVVELPLRVDLADRPRQLVDPVHGKPARTTWEVLGHSGSRTRLALFPETGRTHQLRIHAAHPLGLGAPIVGDRLYGHPGQRLMLHAEALSVLHPRRAERLRFESPAPF